MLVQSIPIQHVPEISCDLSELQGRIEAQKNEPFVIKRLAHDWPVVKADQSPDTAICYLERFATDRPVTSLRLQPGESIGYSPDVTGFNFKQDRRPFTLLLDELRQIVQGPTTVDGLYLGSTNIDHWLPGFREENSFDLLEDWNPLASLWLGTRSLVAAHFDFPSNLACVVFGKRRFTLFPPEAISNLYVGPLDRTPAGQPISLARTDRADDPRYPRFKDALNSAKQALLHPGDAIYIPSLWWHEIESLSSLNGLINFWWRSNDAHFGAPLAALQHLTLALRSIPEPERQRWRPIIEHYIFGSDDTVVSHIPQHARGILDHPNEEEALRFKAYLSAQLNPGSRKL
jgi:hypothetical protein